MNYKKFMLFNAFIIFFISSYKPQCPPEPERAKIKIVTFNTKSHDRVDGVSWRSRLDNFVEDVIVPYRPGIIGLQEIYLHGLNCDLCPDGENVAERVYVGYLLNSIKNKLGADYYVASALRVNYARMCFFCDEWEGDCVIYDPEQVILIPFNEDNGYGRECESWDQDNLMEERNDCQPLSGRGSTKLSKSVFEFPKGSNVHIFFYNVHLNVSGSSDQFEEAFDFITYRHNNAWRRNYTPVFVGDFNLKSHQLIDDYFEDPIGQNEIDKILVGKQINHWTTDFSTGWQVIDKKVFKNSDERVYSDHPVMLVELEAWRRQVQ